METNAAHSRLRFLRMKEKHLDLEQRAEATWPSKKRPDLT